MLSRRCRIQAKPNISKVKTEPVRPVDDPPQAPPVAPEPPPIDGPFSAPVTVPTTSVVPNPPVQLPLLEPNACSSKESVCVPAVVPPTSDSPSAASLSPLSLRHSSVPPRSNKTKKFTGEEELDPKTMTMFDLISWNPKGQKGLEKKHFEVLERAPLIVNEAEKVVAPQLKMEGNRLVLDESSLVVSEQNSAWQVVDDDTSIRKINSSSFKKWRRGSVWTEKETDLFYEVLRSTGPDFGLMHDFFPSRARNELKSKFNREEKHNWMRLNEVLSAPRLLETSLYDKAAEMAEDIEKEKYEKKKRPAKNKEKEAEEWDEDRVDLVKEAEHTIRTLIAIDQHKMKQAQARERRQKKALSDKTKQLLAEVEADEKDSSDHLEGYPEEETSSAPSDDEDYNPRKRKTRK